MSKKQPQWEIEFDEKHINVSFLPDNKNQKTRYYPPLKFFTGIKSFIRNLLKKETKQAIEKVRLREEDLIDRKRGGFTIDCPEYEDGYMDALADLEKKKKQVIKSYENS